MKFIFLIQRDSAAKQEYLPISPYYVLLYYFILL